MTKSHLKQQYHNEYNHEKNLSKQGLNSKPKYYEDFCMKEQMKFRH